MSKHQSYNSAAPPKLAWTPVPNTMLLTIRCNLATFAGYKTFQMQQLFHFAGLLALHAFQKSEHRELSAPPNIMQLGRLTVLCRASQTAIFNDIMTSRLESAWRRQQWASQPDRGARWLATGVWSGAWCWQTRLETAPWWTGRWPCWWGQPWRHSSLSCPWARWSSPSPESLSHWTPEAACRVSIV